MIHLAHCNKKPFEKILLNIFIFNFIVTIVAVVADITATTIIIISNETIINNVIIRNVVEESKTIIIITRITIIIVIKTEIRELRTITGIAAEDLVPFHDPRKDQTRVVAMEEQLELRLNSSNRIRSLKTTLQLIRAGRSLHKLVSNSIKMKARENATMDVDQAEVVLVENGISSAVAAKLITLFRYHVTNVLNRSSLEPLIRASILANTKTFPWRRRVRTFLRTLHPLMISS